MSTPEELKSLQQKQRPNQKGYGPDGFSGSLQRTQLKAERQAYMKNTLKAVVQPKHMKNSEHPKKDHSWNGHLYEDETHHRDQKQCSPSRTRTASVTIGSSSYTAQAEKCQDEDEADGIWRTETTSQRGSSRTSLSMASAREVVACKTKECSGTSSRSDGLRVACREGSVSVLRAYRVPHSIQEQHKTISTHKRWRFVTVSPWTS